MKRFFWLFCLLSLNTAVCVHSAQGEDGNTEVNRQEIVKKENDDLERGNECLRQALRKSNEQQFQAAEPSKSGSIEVRPLFEMSIEYYNSAIALNPASLDAIFNRSYANLRLQNFRESEDDLKKVLLISPKHFKANVNLGMLYLDFRSKLDPKGSSLEPDAYRRAQQNTKISQDFDIQLPTYPDRADPGYGDIDKALRYFRKAKLSLEAKSPENASVLKHDWELAIRERKYRAEYMEDRRSFPKTRHALGFGYNSYSYQWNNFVLPNL
jgi:tetratricopeptide (TPR) repeat protein